MTTSFLRDDRTRRALCSTINLKTSGTAVVPGNVEVELATADVVEVERRRDDGFARRSEGRRCTLPNGLMMALAAAHQHGLRRIAETTRARVGGKSFLRRTWQAVSTKQRPSSATCCIEDSQVSRSSAVGAQ